MTRNKATLIGFTAILLWSFLALFTVGSSPVPPLLLNAICFAISGCLALLWTLRSGKIGALREVPIGIYLFGTAGLFGYHALYFTALRLAPAAEAGLIAYLWPLLIVLFSGLLPGEELRRGHILGGLVAFTGAGLIIGSGAGGFSPGAIWGYAAAFGCALVWSGYSVLSRRFGKIPTHAVTVYCLATAVLSAALHLGFETPQLPASFVGWVSILLLGLGPVGLAFFVWDIGMKHGDIQLLGTAAYAAPLLSTLILVASGIAPMSSTLVIAAILISVGALLAARAGKSDH